MAACSGPAAEWSAAGRIRSCSPHTSVTRRAAGFATIEQRRRGRCIWLGDRDAKELVVVLSTAA
jgi:hypothetical protein